MFDHAGRMLTRDDLTSPEALERKRRSVAMLSPGQMALKREEAMLLLDVLVAQLRDAPPAD